MQTSPNLPAGKETWFEKVIKKPNPKSNAEITIVVSCAKHVICPRLVDQSFASAFGMDK